MYVPYDDGRLNAAAVRAAPPTAWIDAVVTLAVGLTAVVAITVAEEPSTRFPDVGAFALGLGIGALLTVRRRWPLGVLVFGSSPTRTSPACG